MSTIAVIGTGYVGLTTGAYLSHLGHSVICADVVPEKVERLNRGDVPIFEAGLDELVREGLLAGRLSFVLGAAAAVDEAEFVFLCVQTPQGADGSADLSYIRQAASDIGPTLRPETIVINKSTVPVGSTRVVEQALERDDVFVVSNPEFLREGSAVHDCLNPDRIVIGSDDQAAAMRVRALFENLKAPIVITDPVSAETIKYASNAFLATKVSFVNALANVCEAVGADVREVVLGMGYDKRIGFEFLKPGPGFGGSCFRGDETVLVRRGHEVRLLRFVDLFAEVSEVGPEGWEALSWRPGDPSPEFLPIAAFTARPHEGDLLEVRTKMGRRLVVTPEHPFVVGDGAEGEQVRVKLASDLTAVDWLPVAQGFPLLVEDAPSVDHLLDAIPLAGLDDRQVLVNLAPEQLERVRTSAHRLPSARRSDILRQRMMRYDELRALSIPATGGRYKTAENGTQVPDTLLLDADFWRMLGLYLAEGAVTTDGGWSRISWFFHPTDEEDLCQFVRSYWENLGVKVLSFHTPPSCKLTISSRLLATWFTDLLGVGRDCYSKRLPDLTWALPEERKRALLRGLWDGDGSWSLVNGGPSVVLEYGTVSRELADGMLRLFGDLDVVARLRVGRIRKSTVDTYWLTIAGTEQVENCLWLLPEQERREVALHIEGQAKRIKPAGFRQLSKNAAWVRVIGVRPVPHAGLVFSVEVADAHTVVTTGGLIAHNCFPKDTRAMVHIAEDHGYDFGLLRGVITVNDEQYERMAAKVERAAGGSLVGKTVAAWGLAFKARTDDLRDSPAIEVIHRLTGRGAAVRAYDPAVSTKANPPEIDGVELTRDPYAACEDADVLVVLTEWDEFRWLDFAKVAGLMRTPRLVDTRNLLEPAAVRRRGFTYDGLGRA